MAIPIVQTIEITDAGGTFTVSTTPTAPDIVWLYSSAPVVLSNDVTIDFDTIPTNCNTIFCWAYGSGDLDIGSYNFQINGYFYAQEVFNVPSAILGLGSDNGYLQIYVPNLSALGALSGTAITDNTIALAKLTELASGRIILGNSSDRPTAVAMSGDATLSNTGALTIANSAITNVKVDASAAIARTKLATGTADHVVINSNTGAFSSEAQLAPARGGTGQNNSASTGFQLWNAGTSSVTAISETIQLLVSFEAAGGTTPSVGDFKIKMPYAGTVTEIYAYAVKAIAGTDNGTIVPKNNGGTTMGSGTITFTASDARGTAYTSTPATNNTFAAGDLLTFTTAKTTAGGLVQLSITVTRTS